jgi:hypothetical protein
MKKILFLIAFSHISLIIYSQEVKINSNREIDYPVHVAGDFSIAGSPNILFNTPNGTQFAGGLKLRMFLSKRISFDTDLVFGRDYIHGGPGIIGIPFWLLFSRPEGLQSNDETTFYGVLFVIAAMILSAEHTAYHIPVKRDTDISPYISLLRYKSSYKYGDYSNTKYAGEQFSFALGLEINKYFKNFQLAPYIEYNIGYADHIGGFNTGIYCGYYFHRN